MISCLADKKEIQACFLKCRIFFRCFVACMKDTSLYFKMFENFSQFFLIFQSCQICFDSKSMASARKIHLPHTHEKQTLLVINFDLLVYVLVTYKGVVFFQSSFIPDNSFYLKLKVFFLWIKILGLRYCIAYQNKDFFF